uniref:Uncharacterized protein n=1 Tax=viral metagenome TaxID=1070528 RepID=A0A6C0HS51_9ZZZZ
MSNLKLGKNVLSYFEKKRNEEGKTCILYIDGHGSESGEEKCSNSSTIFSFAGVSGALSYAHTRFDNRMNVVPGSSYYRTVISDVKSTNLKQRAFEMARVLKPRVKELVDFRNTTPHEKLTRKYFDKYGMVPMKQLKRKEYTFIDSPKNIPSFDFGVFVLDTSSPDTESLIGHNIISDDFLIEFYDTFPDAVQYLTDLSTSDENEELLEKYSELTSTNSPNCVIKISFEQIIHLLSLLGFEYTYIFDDSCRFTSEIDEEEIVKMAEKERKLSLNKLSVKMKSTDMPKTRKKVLSANLSKTLRGSFLQDIENTRTRFHKKIENKVYEIYDSFNFSNTELEPMGRDNKKISFYLFVNNEKVAVIEILFDFLKVSNIVIDQVKESPYVEEFIEKIKRIN